MIMALLKNKQSMHKKSEVRSPNILLSLNFDYLCKDTVR